METKLLDVNNESLSIAAKLIRSGEIVAFPTETVYGLGADTFNANAISKIYLAKGRPQSNPLIVHISNFDMLSSVCDNISADAQKVINAFMPGPITVVLPKKSVVPNSVTASLPTVAVRMPSSTAARQFIEQCGVPIAAPSANTSSRPSPTSAQDVYEDLVGKIPLILKGDNCQVGIESTVISLVNEPIVLRPGIITPAQISAVLGKQVQLLKDTTSHVNSPGVFFKHYMPSCPAVLLLGQNPSALCSHYDASTKRYKCPCILCQGKFLSLVGNRTAYNMGDTEEEVAHNYFALLRQTEKVHDYIIIMFNSQTEVGESILNRMTKSVSGNIIAEGEK